MTNEMLNRFAARFAIPIAIVAVAAGALSLQRWEGAPLPSTPADIASEAGVELPVVWSDTGKRLVELGAIDREKWLELYGELTDEEKRLLDGTSTEKLRITRENAPYLLNLLWAFGLANKNSILEEGEMSDPAYGGAGGFASTGGWPLAKGDAMEHYSAHALVSLTGEEQRLVEKVSRGIYRPCCGNSTHFPDCNHGMAMLGLLEIMASQGASEDEMWDAALAVNSYWFPDTYFTIAAYMKGEGIEWEDVSPQEVLGAEYSSAEGYARVAAEVRAQGGSGASCSV